MCWTDKIQPRPEQKLHSEDKTTGQRVLGLKESNKLLGLLHHTFNWILHVI